MFQLRQEAATGALLAFREQRHREKREVMENGTGPNREPESTRLGRTDGWWWGVGHSRFSLKTDQLAAAINASAQPQEMSKH